MPRFYKHFVYSVLCAAASVFAQAGSPILALEMPPPGGDGYSALQSGGAFPTGATSLYYNPALLAELQRATGSQLHAAFSRQTWPSSWGAGISQNFSGAALTIPDANGFDLGIGFFRNQMDLGEVLDGMSGTRYHSVENVYGLGAGLRLGIPVSVGGAVKYYDSQIAPSASARLSGWAFDLGASANPHFHPLASAGLLSLEARPAAGVALQNLGPDVRYPDPEIRDPLPRTLRGSLGLEAEFADLLKISSGHDWEKTWTRRNSFSGASAVRTYGVNVSLAGFQYGWGWLEDPRGERHWAYQAYQFEMNVLQGYRLWQRAKRRDFLSAPEAMEAGYPFAKLRILGVSYRPNPRFVIGKRVYDEDSQDLRSLQKAWHVSLSI